MIKKLFNNKNDIAKSINKGEKLSSIYYNKNNSQDNTQYLHGDLETCYNIIKDQYLCNDAELINYLEYFKCIDLTLNEQVKLYSMLRENFDGDIVVRIIDNDNIEILSNGKYTNFDDIKNKIY